MLLEFRKQAVDSKKVLGALPAVISKAFDCLNHDLLITKLHAHGLHLSALELLQDYLLDRKQRTKTDCSLSGCGKILAGVLQGSILDHLLINIFMCEMFLTLHMTCFARHADDNTPFFIRDNIKDVI